MQPSKKQYIKKYQKKKYPYKQYSRVQNRVQRIAFKDDTKVLTLTNDFTVPYMHFGRGLVIIPHHIDKLWKPSYTNSTDPGDAVLVRSILSHGKLLKQF